MQTRFMGIPPSPIKNEDMSITVHGKTYAVVSEKQFKYLRQKALEEIYAEAARRQENPITEEIQAQLEKSMDGCGFSTLDRILAKMTPDERERWKIQYRFSCIKRHPGGIKAGGVM